MVAKRSKAHEIRITRIYNAPVKTVWDAWTDPKQVSQWWGPRGFSVTTHAKDLRVGGAWIYTMHGPDGTDYPNKHQYLEIETGTRLVYDHGAHDEHPPLFRVTVTFAEVGGKTRMEMCMSLASPEAAEETRKFVKKAGGDATWDRLGEFLAKNSATREQFIITRSFAAPINLMYDLWTNPQHFSQWLAPTGSTMEFLKADIRPGGSTMYCMGNKDFKMYGRAHYLEMVKPSRLVYTQQFCTVDGAPARHPMAPTWPNTMLTYVEFAEEENGHTRVTVTWEAIGPVSLEELATFTAGRSGMTMGWTGSFDKLEDYIQSLGA